jgi:hypothetical protein
MNNHFNKKGKIVGGNNKDLQNKSVVMYHYLVVVRYFRAIVTTKKVGTLFYWNEQ